MTPLPLSDSVGGYILGAIDVDARIKNIIYLYKWNNRDIYYRHHTVVQKNDSVGNIWEIDLGKED